MSFLVLARILSWKWLPRIGHIQVTEPQWCSVGFFYVACNYPCHKGCTQIYMVSQSLLDNSRHKGTDTCSMPEEGSSIILFLARVYSSPQHLYRQSTAWWLFLPFTHTAPRPAGWEVCDGNLNRQLQDVLHGWPTLQSALEPTFSIFCLKGADEYLHVSDGLILQNLQHWLVRWWNHRNVSWPPLWSFGRDKRLIDTDPSKNRFRE